MLQGIIQQVLKKRTLYEEFLTAEKEVINQIAPGIGEGSKFIRSLFLFINSKEITKKHIETAAVIELIHNASLFHDDVIDSNNTRRNKPSLLKSFGEKMSVIKGDLLLSLALNFFFSKQKGETTALKYLLRESFSTAYGAFLEQQLNNFETPIISNYIRTVSLKTSSLFKLSGFLGAFFSNVPFEIIKQAAISGLVFGTIFQIQNDLDSYKHKSFEASEDYVQKNITAPVIVMHELGLLDLKAFKEQTNNESYELIKSFIETSVFRKKIQTIEKFAKQKLNRFFD